MRLNNKNRVITHSPDKVVRVPKKVVFFKYLYLAVLLFIILFLIYYFAYRFVTVKGTGTVQFETYQIKAPMTGIVSHITNKTHVHSSDLLCNIEDIHAKITPKTTIIIQKTNLDLASRIIALKTRIVELKANYKLLKEKEKQLKTKYRQMQLLYESELYNPREKYLKSLEDQLNAIKLNLISTRQKLTDYIQLLKSIKQERLQLKNTHSIQPKSILSFPIHAPFEADIIKHIRLENSFVKSGEPLFTLIKEQFEIVGYFSQKYINYLHKKDKIQIILPNNKITYGIVKSIEFTENIVFNNQTPTLQKLIVKIEPLEKDIFFWKKFRFFKVKLRKYKWNS